MNGKIKATRHFLLAVTFVATSVLSAFAQISPCLVEAEAFADKGGWVADPQFVEQMGSPYLLAHGKGIPVADAKTSVNIKPGRVRAFVRTRDWTPDWDGEKPRFFKSVYFEGCNVAPEHAPNNGITEVEIPAAKLPAGKKLTIAVRPVSSLGTKGKTIGMAIRV